MSPEDLQIAHTHLFACVDRQQLTCNAPESSTVCSELLNNPRFDLVARSSHLPEFLERIHRSSGSTRYSKCNTSI
ncbi:hypothetical protein DSO57_1012546 [Entomophthora muscae]|uniref:Uncharacterized protein n=1 Tax=Entomophthora muscae TaxID=34485 RepID=A0ACC2TGG4_9FUNG|nr:hypothetical protein DSO57_1012546 [Entomophthora muscae]